MVLSKDRPGGYGEGRVGGRVLVQSIGVRQEGAFSHSAFGVYYLFSVREKKQLCPSLTDLNIKSGLLS